MKLRIRRTFVVGMVVVAMVAFCFAPAAKAEFQLTDNDRVVLFGDVSFGHSFAPEWFCQFIRTRYPDLKLEFYCLAKSRSDAAEGNKRFPVEVAPLKPTWVILSFGLDSPNRQAFNQARLDSYVKEMSKMIDSVKATGAKLLILTPPPPQDSKHKSLQAAKYEDVIAKYADALREVAKSKDAEILDWHKAGSEYKASLGDGPDVHWTKRGVQPLGLSLSVAIDLILTRLGAEPVEYKVEADWDTDKATTSSGTVEVANHDKNSMTFDLTDIPVTLDMNARGRIENRSWPLSNWCKLIIKINGMPPGGLLVSNTDGKNGKPFLQQQFEVGADMSQIGPLARNNHIAILHNAIRTKLGQCSKYRETMMREVPEPELKKGYELYKQADMELMIAAQKSKIGRHRVTMHLSRLPRHPEPRCLFRNETQSPRDRRSQPPRKPAEINEQKLVSIMNSVEHMSMGHMSIRRHLRLVDKLVLLAAFAVAATLFLSVGWMAVAPSDPQGAVSLLTHENPALMVVEALALAAVTASLATLIAGSRLPDVGIFAVALGLALTSIRGGTATYLLITMADGDRGAERMLAGQLAGEALIWTGVIFLSMVIGGWITRHFQNSGSHFELGQLHATGILQPVHLTELSATECPGVGKRLGVRSDASQPLSVRLAGLKTTIVTGVVAMFAFNVLVSGRLPQSIKHGQVIFAVSASFFSGRVDCQNVVCLSNGILEFAFRSHRSRFGLLMGGVCERFRREVRRPCQRADERFSTGDADRVYCGWHHGRVDWPMDDCRPGHVAKETWPIKEVRCVEITKEKGQLTL